MEKFGGGSVQQTVSYLPVFFPLRSTHPCLYPSRPRKNLVSDPGTIIRAPWHANELAHQADWEGAQA